MDIGILVLAKTFTLTIYLFDSALIRILLATLFVVLAFRISLVVWKLLKAINPFSGAA